jgi:hypothetical protein
MRTQWEAPTGLAIRDVPSATCFQHGQPMTDHYFDRVTKDEYLVSAWAVPKLLDEFLRAPRRVTPGGRPHPPSGSNTARSFVGLGLDMELACDE